MTGDHDEHPALGLDEVVHQRTRLAILTVLAETGRCDFTYLKKVLSLTDGNLGRHLEILEQAGLVRIKKGYEAKRPRTWAQITPQGGRALAAYIELLKSLVERVETADHVET